MSERACVVGGARRRVHDVTDGAGLMWHVEREWRKEFRQCRVPKPTVSGRLAARSAH